MFDVLAIEDVSHAGAKRYDVTLRLHDEATAAEVGQAIEREVAAARLAEVHFSEEARRHWGSAPAQVVWLTVLRPASPDVVAHSEAEEPLVLALWIDPELPENQRPAPLDRPQESIRCKTIPGEISLQWGGGAASGDGRARGG